MVQDLSDAGQAHKKWWSLMIPSFATADLLALLAAILLAAFGGESFLKGVLGMGTWLRLPNFLVATPELTVSTMAALAGKPEIGLGDALGSHVVNIALTLGLALLFGALTARLAEFRRDFVLALGVPVLTLVLPPMVRRRARMVCC
jgi:cation:H+ antiporter